MITLAVRIVLAVGCGMGLFTIVAWTRDGLGIADFFRWMFDRADLRDLTNTPEYQRRRDDLRMKGSKR